MNIEKLHKYTVMNYRDKDKKVYVKLLACKCEIVSRRLKALFRYSVGIDDDLGRYSIYASAYNKICDQNAHILCKVLLAIYIRTHIYEWTFYDFVIASVVRFRSNNKLHITSTVNGG